MMHDLASGSDAFDWPVPGFDEEEVYDPYDYLYCYDGKRFKSLRRKFVWTDREGNDHKLRDIDDRYLSNVISFLERVASAVGEYPNHGLVLFLKDELSYRQSDQYKDEQYKKIINRR